ncbi:protein DUF721 [Candidatus Termititenax dinenymphae]|uniref:Protein DUF721 n=1 Tax=Candidatus Termititenax dinenymphae TaxID=2218523 RepID=A0A388TJD7_9BACT|nr:protein DUF721 [Candidatus Termititenax dinenymphae]
METLANTLKRILNRDYRFNEIMCMERLKAAWLQAAGAGFKAQPQDYKNKTLYCAAVNSSWADNARFQEQALIEKYKTCCPDIVIKKIQFKGTGYVEPESKQNKKEERRVCPACGEKFIGTENVCILCRNKKEQKEIKAVLKYLADTPWARYQDIKADLPQITEERFYKVQYDLREEMLYSLWRNPNQAAAVKYVMLKTGLSPDKINDKIVTEGMPKKLYKLIYEHEGE